jgi:hypothetical protein
LGLERIIWERIPATEQARYRIVAYCFVSLTALAGTAAYMLLWLVTSSLAACILAGSMLAFVVSNVIRFSMITLRRSLYETSAEALPAGMQAGGGKTNKAIQVILKRLKAIIVPDFGTVVRVIVLFIMLQVIALPNMMLLNWGALSELNTVHRHALIGSYETRLSEEYGRKFRWQEEKIRATANALDTMGRENAREFNPLLQKKQDELEQLEAGLAMLRRQQDSVSLVWTPAYARQLESRYFPVLTFRAVAAMPLTWLWESVLIGLMFYPLYLLKRLRNGGNFIYAEASTAHYRALVIHDYEQHLDVIQERLKTLGVKSAYHEIWEDPPFCTRYKKTFRAAVQVPLQSLNTASGLKA